MIHRLARRGDHVNRFDRNAGLARHAQRRFGKRRANRHIIRYARGQRNNKQAAERAVSRLPPPALFPVQTLLFARDCRRQVKRDFGRLALASLADLECRAGCAGRDLEDHLTILRAVGVNYLDH